MFPVPTHLFRPGSDDGIMWGEVWNDDDYRLVAADVRDRVVLDIGAGVGAFAARCLDLGARQVVSVEPNPDTCRVYRQVMGAALEDRGAVLVEAGAWNEAKHGLLRSHRNGYHGCDMIVDAPDDQTVECLLVPFHSLIAKHQPQAIKIDAEGAEYPMLLPAPLPDLTGVQVMWVEYHHTRHDWRRAGAMTGITDLLRQTGFTAERVKDADGVVYRYRRAA